MLKFYNTLIDLGEWSKHNTEKTGGWKYPFFIVAVLVPQERATQSPHPQTVMIVPQLNVKVLAYLSPMSYLWGIIARSTKTSRIFNYGNCKD